MIPSPAAIEGSDYRLTFELAPGDLSGAILARVVGRFNGAVLLAAYTALVRFAQGDVLNVIADTRGSETFLDFAAYEAVTRVILAHGIRRLNLVVCEKDPGRRYVVRFGNEVAGLGGLDVHSAFVSDLPSALASMATLMSEAGSGPAPDEGIGARRS